MGRADRYGEDVVALQSRYLFLGMSISSTTAILKFKTISFERVERYGEEVVAPQSRYLFLGMSTSSI